MQRHDSMRLTDLNLSEHLFSAKTLLHNAVSPANFSTTGSDLFLKTPKQEPLPKGAVVVLKEERQADQYDPQEIMI